MNWVDIESRIFVQSPLFQQAFEFFHKFNERIPFNELSRSDAFSLIYKNINTEIMLATKNIDKNTSPIVAYTATSSRMEEYSNWLIEYIDLLGIKAHLQRWLYQRYWLVLLLCYMFGSF